MESVLSISNAGGMEHETALVGVSCAGAASGRGAGGGRDANDGTLASNRRGRLHAHRQARPSGGGGQAAVVFINGSGPNTYDNTRQLDETTTYNYFDLFAERLTAGGTAFFRWSTRGCTPGGEPPLYTDIDEAAYQTYVPGNQHPRRGGRGARPARGRAPGKLPADAAGLERGHDDRPAGGGAGQRPSGRTGAVRLCERHDDGNAGVAADRRFEHGLLPRIL